MRSQTLNITFRETVDPADPERIYRLTASCDLFYPEEIVVARELVEENLIKGTASGYYFLFAERNGSVAGYTCFGPIPMTRGRFDLYWVAVQKNLQGTGIGKRLMELTESRIRELNGRRIYVETSSRKIYEPTHRFYHACAYRAEAVLKDFYAAGDDKVIYLKVIRDEKADG
jgi:GNAT superfamily N-acetyltransferase